MTGVARDVRTAGALPPLALDRSDPTPLYFQVSRHIERAVEDGALRPGDRLDGEIGLAERLGVSRATMRRAIQELVARGVLVRKHGVGTQIVDSRRRRRGGLSSLYDDLRRADRTPTTRVLKLDHVEATTEIASVLDVPVGDEVICLERLRSDGDDPVGVMHNWLPADVADFSIAQLEQHGLYELLRLRGLAMRLAHQTISAEPADLPRSRLLEVRKGTPLLTMHTVTYTDIGRPVDFGQHVYRPDRYRFEITNVDS